MTRLSITHIELKEANEFVARNHRHHKPVLSHRFSIGVEMAGELVGVAIVGRPVARGCDYRTTLEVTRLCTDGTKNACSILYAAAARAGRELGYKVIQTYILQEELGVSLRAAGWELAAKTKGGSWNTPARTGRREDQPQQPKQRWEKRLCA